MDNTENAGESGSASPMPQRRHRHQAFTRHHSSGEAHEQTPLLTASTRGRVRIHGDHLSTNPHGYLSRNQSYTGMCTLLIPPG